MRMTSKYAHGQILRLKEKLLSADITSNWKVEWVGYFYEIALFMQQTHCEFSESSLDDSQLGKRHFTA